MKKWGDYFPCFKLVCNPLTPSTCYRPQFKNISTFELFNHAFLFSFPTNLVEIVDDQRKFQSERALHRKMRGSKEKRAKHDENRICKKWERTIFEPGD